MQKKRFIMSAGKWLMTEQTVLFSLPPYDRQETLLQHCLNSENLRIRIRGFFGCCDRWSRRPPQCRRIVRSTRVVFYHWYDTADLPRRSLWTWCHGSLKMILSSFFEGMKWKRKWTTEHFFSVVWIMWPGLDWMNRIKKPTDNWIGVCRLCQSSGRSVYQRILHLTVHFWNSETILFQMFTRKLLWYWNRAMQIERERRFVKPRSGRAWKFHNENLIFCFWKEEIQKERRAEEIEEESWNEMIS